MGSFCSKSASSVASIDINKIGVFKQVDVSNTCRTKRQHGERMQALRIMLPRGFTKEIRCPDCGESKFTPCFNQQCGHLACDNCSISSCVGCGQVHCSSCGVWCECQDSWCQLCSESLVYNHDCVHCASPDCMNDCNNCYSFIIII